MSSGGRGQERGGGGGGWGGGGAGPDFTDRDTGGTRHTAQWSNLSSTASYSTPVPCQRCACVKGLDVSSARTLVRSVLLYKALSVSLDAFFFF